MITKTKLGLSRIASSIAQWLAFALSDPAPPGSIPGVDVAKWAWAGPIGVTLPDHQSISSRAWFYSYMFKFKQSTNCFYNRRIKNFRGMLCFLKNQV